MRELDNQIRGKQVRGPVRAFLLVLRCVLIRRCCPERQSMLVSCGLLPTAQFKGGLVHCMKLIIPHE